MIYKQFDINETGSLKGGAKLTVYIQEPTDALKIKERPIVLLCPGGGYAYTSDREAEPVALSFLSKGYHAAVLRYSCAPATFPTSLFELGRAILIIRRNAEQWHIKKDAIIVQGCSAGGHLAASFACFWREDFLSEGLSLPSSEKENLRPNGLILCYPVITSGEHAHRGSFENLLGGRYDELLDKVSLENSVNEDVPRTFIWHTFTDQSVPVENSLLFASALRRKMISTELHIFPDGCHGLALANELTMGNESKEVTKSAGVWTELAATWMKDYGFGN